MKSYENPVLQLTFDNEWSVSVARVDDGDYRWNVRYTSPEFYEVYNSFETALEVFQEIAKVQRYDMPEEDSW